MDPKAKEDLEKGLSKAYSEINKTMKNIYPERRKDFVEPDASKKATEKIVELMEYIENKQKEVLSGKEVDPAEVFVELLKRSGGETRVEKLKQALESMSFESMVSIESEGTNIKNYIIFMDNLASESLKRKKNKDLQTLISNISLTPLMGFLQFVTSKFQETVDYLFKKPFRFTSDSVSQLINHYGVLSGYYEIFVKVMILSNDLVYKDKELSELNYKKLSKLDFARVLALTKEIEGFDVFLKPYDKTLRNKILHKEFSVDYENKKILYSGGETSFKKLLENSKDISTILLSYAWLYYFDLKANLQKAYNVIEGLQQKQKDSPQKKK